MVKYPNVIEIMKRPTWTNSDKKVLSNFRKINAPYLTADGKQLREDVARFEQFMDECMKKECRKFAMADQRGSSGPSVAFRGPTQMIDRIRMELASNNGMV